MCVLSPPQSGRPARGSNLFPERRFQLARPGRRWTRGLRAVTRAAPTGTDPRFPAPSALRLRGNVAAFLLREASRISSLGLKLPPKRARNLLCEQVGNSGPVVPLAKAPVLRPGDPAFESQGNFSGDLTSCRPSPRMVRGLFELPKKIF